MGVVLAISGAMAMGADHFRVITPIRDIPAAPRLLHFFFLCNAQ